MTETTDTNRPNLHRGWILAALMCTIMLAAMDSTIVSTAIPQIVEDLGGFSLFSWVFSIYLLAQTVTIPIYGKLADLFGRKPILIIGTLIFLIGSAASAASWDMMSLILFRGLQGLGAGSIMATVNTIAGDIYTVEERAKIQGWLSSVWGVAAIMGPALGGALVQYTSWRWIFLINLPIGVASIFLISVYFKENVKKQRHYIDFPGVALMLLTGTVLIFTLMQGGQSWPWFSMTGIGLILLSLILIVITILAERRSPEPIMPIWVWSNRILSSSNLSIVCMGAIMLGPNMFLPVFSQSVLGLGAIGAGFVLASMSLGWPIASALSGRVYLKIGFRNTAIIGTVVIVLSALGFIFLPADAPIWVYVVNQALLGGGFGFLSTPNLVGIQSIVPWNKRGVVTGANMFSRYLGQTVGAAIIGGVFNSSLGNYLNLASSAFRTELPKVNDVIDVLKSRSTPGPIEEYLRHSFYLATHHVYLVMAIIGVLAFLVLLRLPRQFPVVDG